MRLSMEVHVYMQSAIITVARANISFDSFGEMFPWIDQYSKDCLSLGNTRDLARSYIQHVHDIHIDQIMTLLHNN